MTMVSKVLGDFDLIDRTITITKDLRRLTVDNQTPHFSFDEQMRLLKKFAQFNRNLETLSNKRIDPEILRELYSFFESFEEILCNFFLFESLYGRNEFSEKLRELYALTRQIVLSSQFKE